MIQLKFAKKSLQPLVVQVQFGVTDDPVASSEKLILLARNSAPKNRARNIILAPFCPR